MSVHDSDTDHEDEKCVLRRSGFEYSTRPIPTRQRMRNILTQSFKVIANPRSEIESFELLLSEDILRTDLVHTNRKAREVRRTLSRLQPFKNFIGRLVQLNAKLERTLFDFGANLLAHISSNVVNPSANGVIGERNLPDFLFRPIR